MGDASGDLENLLIEPANGEKLYDLDHTNDFVKFIESAEHACPTCTRQTLEDRSMCNGISVSNTITRLDVELHTRREAANNRRPFWLPRQLPD